MTDTIPVASQIKSILQLLFGESEKALETQINFLDGTPLISQLKSLYEVFISNDLIQAKKTQNKFLIVTNATFDNIPLIGHIKGLGHYLIGDYSNGHNAIKRSTRTTVVILSGYFACSVIIPQTSTQITTITASTIGSIIGGLSMDILINLLSNIIYKTDQNVHHNSLSNILQNPFDIGTFFDCLMGPILDGLIGAFIGFKIYNFNNPLSVHPIAITVSSLPPPPTIPTYIPSIISNHIPLPPPFNPLKYGVAVGVIQRHSNDIKYVNEQDQVKENDLECSDIEYMNHSDIEYIIKNKNPKNYLIVDCRDPLNDYSGGNITNSVNISDKIFECHISDILAKYYNKDEIILYCMFGTERSVKCAELYCKARNELITNYDSKGKSFYYVLGNKIEINCNDEIIKDLIKQKVCVLKHGFFQFINNILSQLQHENIEKNPFIVNFNENDWKSLNVSSGSFANYYDDDKKMWFHKNEYFGGSKFSQFEHCKSDEFKSHYYYHYRVQQTDY